MNVTYVVLDVDQARANDYPNSDVLPSSYGANLDVIYRFEDDVPVELMWFEEYDQGLGLEPIATMLAETYYRGFQDAVSRSYA